MEVKLLSEILVNGIDLLLLDLDNTLYEYKRCHEYALSKLTEQCESLFSITRDEVHSAYYASRKSVHNQHLGTANEHSRLFYIQGMVERFCGTTDTKLIMKLYEVYWSNYIESMQLFDDSIPFLKKCIEQGVKVVMVTDMVADIQFRKIEKLGVGSFLHFIVTSEEAGVEKPHPYIFELAILKGLLVNPQLKKIAVVGDSVKKDIHHSNNYSIDVIHVLRDE